MIDSGIYGNIKQFQMPDIVDNAQKAMSLSQMAMQNRKLQVAQNREDAVRNALSKNIGEDGKLDQAGVLSDLGKIDPEARFEYQDKFSKSNKELADSQGSQAEAMQKIASVTLPDLLYMKKVGPEKAAMLFHPTMEKFSSNGIPMHNVPPEFSQEWLDNTIGALQSSKGNLDNEKTIAETERTKAATKKDYFEMNQKFNNLPPENKEQIGKIAGNNADKVSIYNAIDSTVNLLEDPKINSEQKLVQAKQLIKTLNSTQGKDAVGAEEAKRLASLLEYHYFNITEPGAFFGRSPISDFTEQAKLTSKALKDAAKQGQSQIAQLKTGRPLEINSPSVDSIVGARNPKFSDPTIENANASEDDLGKKAPHGPFVVQGGHKFNWNPKSGKYE